MGIALEQRWELLRRQALGLLRLLLLRLLLLLLHLLPPILLLLLSILLLPLRLLFRTEDFVIIEPTQRQEINLSANTGHAMH